MGIISRLFGRKGGSGPPARDVAELVAPFSKPAVQLLRAADATQSYFGGTPPLTATTPWPSNAGKPLTFLACLDLESLSQVALMPWLPSSGRLLFFYDVDDQPWGFDPEHRGNWSVILVRDETSSSGTSSGARLLPRQYVSFHKIQTYPSWERPDVVALRLDDAERDSLIDVCSAVYGESPGHQVGGYPNAIQSDEMELECQLVSNGINCGDPSGYRRPEVGHLSAGAADWRLLLQVESDDDLELMWGDLGILYFWIREQDALAGRFDKCWVVLQCH